MSGVLASCQTVKGRDDEVADACRARDETQPCQALVQANVFQVFAAPRTHPLERKLPRGN